MEREAYTRTATAGVERADRVWRILVRNVLPFFTMMASTPSGLDRELVVEWFDRLSPGRFALFSIKESAEFADFSEHQIRTLIADKKLVVALDTDGLEHADLAHAVTVTAANGGPMIRLGALEFAIGVKRLKAGYALGTADEIVSAFRRLKSYMVAKRVIHAQVSKGLQKARILGLRIPEAYGTDVGDLIDQGPGDAPGLIDIYKQGG